ncbi:lysosomal alpha-glucosidase-like isoform X3 [Gouania willdenowi]|uniref:lysosomal alpha-glucosidase-like isoform X3 n=1 Tax=Gouania willdenowi TaxID=441366 RepID=UPI0010556362|nr:lysosomal alpha-glucosidase isoform X3 [Gouania willdenowi]
MTSNSVSLFFLFFLLCFYVHLFHNEVTLVKSVRGGKSTNLAQERLFVNVIKPQNSSQVKRVVEFPLPSVHECIVSPGSRFDCGRDRLLSRAECEDRGCCFSPLPLSPGPPWCFYPHMYPGYRLGPFSPTERGQAATLTRETPSYLPKDVSTLSLEVMELNADCLHLTVKDPSSQRYEVQIPGVVPQSKADAAEVLYTIQYQHNPFGFIVQRKSNRRVIMDTTVAPLLFADQYLQLSTMLASTLVSGLGEHYTTLILDLNWTSLTFWNRDMAPHADVNLYGSHPFYIVQEEDGFAHGVFLLNSNAIEVMLQPTPALTWVSTGGILDLYIFLGPDPQSVIRQYLQIIGYPMMPPYWSLGFHLCRWGYTTTNATRRVVQHMHEANIPLDVQWNDLDYASERRVFTFDPLRFGDLPEMVEEFHKRGMKYILILDPGISSTSPPGTYPPFDDGLRRDVFIKNATGHVLIGKVWPGPTAFPDFTNPETRVWWDDFIKNFHSKVPVDGLWIDMNEPASFVQGSVDGCPDSDLENPPYTPKAVNSLQLAPAVLQFSLFGVPLVGADVCGFGGNTTEELCVRWMQLGAFYPFMRNHNDKPNAPQEPYVFGQKAQAAMRSALNLRYSLLPFLYTLFHHAHTSADTVARPLFMEFPTDPNCWTIDHQFLWGSSLLISPVLDEGVVELVAYLPPGTWYSLQNGQPFYSNGQYLLLPAPLDTINVHVREGHIVPRQEPALTTTASRLNPFFLTVALSAGGWAWGDMFWDDGDSLDSFEMQKYCYVVFIVGQSQMISEPIKLNGALDGLVLGGLQVFGVLSAPRYVIANGEKVQDYTYHTDTMVLTVTGLTLPMSEVFTVQWIL